MSDKLLYTVPECVEALSIGSSKVWELIASGRLESVKVGRSRRVTREALERFVEELRTHTNGELP
jgi:excisionase family DNA binding protein